jgi:hypothetical protein
MAALKNKYQDCVVINRDIYNERNRLRAQETDQRPRILALLDELQRTGQTFPYLVNNKDEVTHLYWAHPKSIKLAQRFSHSLVMDSTYKTNRYRMPMLHVVGMASFNTSFTVAIAFMKSEDTASYKWALQELAKIFTGRTQPACITTDREQALINALASTFASAKHLLWVWHVNKNITVHCRTKIQRPEDWRAFEKTWREIIYCVDEESFNREWREMETDYSVYPILITYLKQTWYPCRHKFVRAWTDQVRHFGNATTSRAEGHHSALKSYLHTST